MKNKYLLLLLLLGFSNFFSCKNEQDKIPYVYVYIKKSLHDPELSTLNAIGNAVNVTGGVKGVIIYRKTLDTFLAYEQACPYDPDCGRVSIDKTGTKVIDNVCCKSEFSLILDGAVLKAPATLPLKQYQVYYNPNTEEITISN